MTAPIRFSTLKRIGQSPAHYRHACETPWESTRPMRIGTIVHHIVLGPAAHKAIILFPDGDRRGRQWEAFKAEHPNEEIVTRPEWDDAEPIAAAVLADPVASELLKGARYEVPLKWTDAGIECETGGVDVIGDGFLADLKVTNSTDPEPWSRHAARMMYHAQMAFYDTGAKANGIDTAKGLYLIGVEDKAPYPVTVLRLTAETLDAGKRACALWMERLRMCQDSDQWPGYTQSVVDFVLPSWMGGEGEDE